MKTKNALSNRLVGIVILALPLLVPEAVGQMQTGSQLKLRTEATAKVSQASISLMDTRHQEPCIKGSLYRHQSIRHKNQASLSDLFIPVLGHTHEQP